MSCGSYQKQVYETPLAFIRENVQNAVDAVRIQAHRDSIEPGDPAYRIDVRMDGRKIIVQDNGIGMSEEDLQNFFWTIGASGKRTSEALAAGCVGTFGIGGFANFGVCDTVEVISQRQSDQQGTLTRLSQAEIERAGTAIPSVSKESSDRAAPRGTIVVGTLRGDPNVEELRRYLTDFVKYVPTAVYFGGKLISQSQMSEVADRENFSEVNTAIQTWRAGDLHVTARFFEDRGHALVCCCRWSCGWG